MLETKTTITNIVEEKSKVTKPYIKREFKKAPEMQVAKYDIIKISNDIIFIGLSALSIYLFYNILLSLMM